MTRRLPILAALALSFVVLACARHTDYDYFYNQNKPVAIEHKIKELSASVDLDILWVIDNSNSMSSHQQTVINNMNSFVDGLVLKKNLRWKMGLISTSVGEEPYVGFKPGDTLDYTSPNAATRFKIAVNQLGINGDGTEKEYDPIIRTLNQYPNFLRPNAYLAIITVSDAPEQSQLTTDQFIDSLTRIRGGKLSNVLFYAFVNPIEWCRPTDDPFHWQDSKLEVLLRKIQGSAFKLCDPNFGQNVADLGSNIADQVTSPRIELTERPILSTLKVLHNGREVPGGKKEDGGYWTYDVRANAIVFNDLSFAPNPNESVRVVYEVDEN